MADQSDIGSMMDIWVRKVMTMTICYAFVILGAGSSESTSQSQSPRRFERGNQGDEALLSFLEGAGSSPISPTSLMVPLTLIQDAAIKGAGIPSFSFLTLRFFVNHYIEG